MLSARYIYDKFRLDSQSLKKNASQHITLTCFLLNSYLQKLTDCENEYCSDELRLIEPVRKILGKTVSTAS